MRYKYFILLPFIQLCLVVAAIITDQSYNRGLGEGRNQMIANLLTNIEMLIKQIVGIDDVVNYNFTWATTTLSLFFWLLIGYLLDRVVKK